MHWDAIKVHTTTSLILIKVSIWSTHSFQVSITTIFLGHFNMPRDDPVLSVI